MWALNSPSKTSPINAVRSLSGPTLPSCCRRAIAGAEDGRKGSGDGGEVGGGVPDKLAKFKGELTKGVWGYWELGAWKPLGISGRQRARLRKEVLLAGEDWTYDPPRGEMRTKRKGHKVDRIAAEKRANTVELMKKMPQMLLDYKKRRWDKKMKEEDGAKKT